MSPRALAIFALLPRAPRAACVSELVGRLRARGFLVATRTVQRDLVALAKSNSVVRTADGWSAVRGAPCPCCGDRRDDAWIATSRNWRERYVIAARECELLREHCSRLGAVVQTRRLLASGDSR